MVAATAYLEGSVPATFTQFVAASVSVEAYRAQVLGHRISRSVLMGSTGLEFPLGTDRRGPGYPAPRHVHAVWPYG